MQVVLERECFPAVMELFPAASEDQWSYVEKAIDDSDYYVVILAGKYGSVDENGISFTEREYDYAVSQGIPVIAFYHRNLDALPGSKLESSPETRRKIEAFHAKVKGNLCKGWDSPENLALAVGNSLWKLVKDKPREGWVRANQAGDPVLINKLKEHVFELEEELKLSQTAAPAGTEKLASGGDKISLQAKISYSTSGNILEPTRRTVAHQFTWDYLISQLGPMMFDESTERGMRTKISSLIHGKVNWPSHAKHCTADVQDDHFYTVISQFRALGFIEKSNRKHAAGDSNKYWRLTPYGEHYVIRLKAIQKKSTKQAKIKKT